MKKYFVQHIGAVVGVFKLHIARILVFLGIHFNRHLVIHLLLPAIGLGVS
jgi:hypothetical protein